MIALSFWLLLALSGYLLYPVLMKWRVNGTRLPYIAYHSESDLPEVSVFIPMHNEALVIEKKLKSILDSHYPEDKLKVYCGLDGCTDQSADIIQNLQSLYPGRLFLFASERIGKPEMLNEMYRRFNPDNNVLILTDANVFFMPETVFELVKYFKDEEIGLVDAGFIVNSDLVSHKMEGEYLGFEQSLKFAEGKKWGTMQGPFGGCYAIRGELFKMIPQGFLVDDFFIAMSVMQDGYKSILNPQAKVIEEVHTDWKDEFRRKKRISAGNFQNLSHFRKVLFKPFTPLAFSFFFHKVIRWMLPVLALPVFLVSILEVYVWHFKVWPLLITLTLILAPIPFNYLLHKLNLHSRTIQRLSYLVYINIALLYGFINYSKGIQSNVWKPTQRK